MANVTPVHLEKYLKGMDYPASKEDLLACAKRNGADLLICDIIQRLPDEHYDKSTDGLMLGEDLDAQAAAYRVGYQDASHFNREYRSLFGVPPMRDVQRLRGETLAFSGQ